MLRKPTARSRDNSFFLLVALFVTAVCSADDMVRSLMSPDLAERRKAAEEILLAKEKRFIPSVAEVCFYYTLKRNASGVEEISALLRELTGHNEGKKYFDWLQWVGKHPEIKPLPDYIQLKSEILSTIDPAFSKFFEDEKSFRIRPEEIVWGGVKKDGIPALVNPPRISSAKADYLEESNRVLGVSLKGESRAYPLRLMDWHEMANDVIGGIPITIPYCTLCGSAILYNARVGDQTYTFGSSGLLYRSNKLMYDHQTLSLWSALSGEPVAGKLVDQKIQLEILPIVVTTWAEWKRRHPDTTVLSKNTGHVRDYDVEPYKEYFASDKNMFPVPVQSDVLKLKDFVFALRMDKTKKAYPMEILSRKKFLKDKVDGIDVVLIADEAGKSARAYRCVSSSADSSWKITEEALLSPDGKEKCDRLPGHIAYWFGWYAQFPDTQLYD